MTAKTRTSPRRLVLLAQVCEREGYEWASQRWLRRLIQERRITSRKIGGKLLVDLDDLDDLAESGKREAAAS